MKPIRITELSQMGTCEQKWWYRYGDPDAAQDDEGGSQAMSLGTLLHAWWGEWWMTPGGYDDIRMDAVIEAVPEDRRTWSEATAKTADWLMRRFDEVYQPEHHEWEMVHNEIELSGVIDGLECEGRADGIVRHKPTDRLFLAECKSMKDWRRLDILQVDPQLTHYWTLARASGIEVDGILYDAIKTYVWKRDEHPAQDSFTRLFLDRTLDHARAAYGHLHAFADRRYDLAEAAPYQGLPLRNISAQTCSWCQYRPRCWEELAFPQDCDDIELEDE